MKIDRTFLKNLWDGKKVLCPKCNEEYLIPLHKNDNNNFKCPKCSKVYRTINILNKILQDNG